MTSWKRLTFAVVTAAALIIVGLNRPAPSRQATRAWASRASAPWSLASWPSAPQSLASPAVSCGSAGRAPRLVLPGSVLLRAAGLVRLRLRRPLLRQ